MQTVDRGGIHIKQCQAAVGSSSTVANWNRSPVPSSDTTRQPRRRCIAVTRRRHTEAAAVTQRRRIEVVATRIQRRPTADTAVATATRRPTATRADTGASVGASWKSCSTDQGTYLALTCDREVMRKRLRDEPRIDEMLEFNDWVIREALTMKPPMLLLDTTSRAVRDTAREVAAWVRAGLANSVVS